METGSPGRWKQSNASAVKRDTILRRFTRSRFLEPLMKMKRPKFTSMVSAILENGCNTVVVESLDRLAREYRVQEQMLIYLASKEIDLIAANTGENITAAIQADPMKKALVQIQGVFAELDKSLLVRKLRRARDKVRKENGRCEGPRPYGSTPEEAEILKKVRYLRRRSPGQKKPRTYQAIAEQLNGEGISTRRGKKMECGFGSEYPCEIVLIFLLDRQNHHKSAGFQ